jgi:transcriptional regulator with XRE-family HTH domain
MPDPEVGRRIRLVRQKLGFTQTEFAAKIGRRKLAVVHYEAGRIPPADVLDGIARLAGVALTWLLHGEEKSAGADRPTRSVSEEMVELAGKTPSPRLPTKYEKRYQLRRQELTIRLRRELDEYRKLLELEHRSERTPRKIDSSFSRRRVEQLPQVSRRRR